MKGLARDDEISYPTHWYIRWRLKLRLLSDAFPVINFYSLMLIFIVSVLWFEKMNLICWKCYSNHQWWTNADGRTELMPCWLSATSIFGITLRLSWILFHFQFDYVIDCCLMFLFFSWKCLLRSNLSAMMRLHQYVWTYEICLWYNSCISSEQSY